MDLNICYHPKFKQLTKKRLCATANNYTEVNVAVQVMPRFSKLFLA